MVRAHSPQRILLVEDSPADVMLLRMALEDAGVAAELTVCGDGETAIAHVASGAEPPDLVLLDLNVPCHDGLEILEAMRATPRWRRTRVVVFTSAVSPSDRKQIERYEATFVPKPQSYSGFISAAAEIARGGVLPQARVQG